MRLSRRALLAAGVTLPVAGWQAPLAAAAPAMPAIHPRSEWAGNRAPKGALEPETDVRFLLVHHTETPNDDAPDKTPERLRAIYAFHTGASKGWPDVAYNFFVDRHGEIWEGRQGSIERAVRGDATGGSQGFAELACFVGDFMTQAPSEQALGAMAALLAWLASRNGLDLAGPVTFTSRGSNKWRKGAQVTTEQIAGHRDMSATQCPGDVLYPLVAGRLLPDARALLAGLAPTPGPSPTPTPSEPPTAAPAVPPPATPPPAEALSWAGAALTALGLGGVAASALAGRRAEAAAETTGPAVTRPEPANSADQLEQDEDDPDGQGDEQADEEPPQGG